jgi:hypothetical protein
MTLAIGGLGDGPSGIKSGMRPRLRPRHTRERFEVGQVPGVKGIVLSDFSMWNGLGFIVEGQRIKPRGIWRRVTLPGTPRNVEAHVKGGLPGAEKRPTCGYMSMRQCQRLVAARFGRVAQ